MLAPASKIWLRVSALASLSLFVIATLPAQGGDAPASRPSRAHIAQHNTGFEPGFAIQASPHVAWKYAPSGASFSDVVAFDGTVVALDRAGAIHALDARSGAVLWKREDKGLKFNYGYGLALTRDPGFDVVLVGGDTGMVAFDRASGETVWKTALPGVCAPTCSADQVFAGCADGKLYACELRTGKVRWKHDFVADRPEDPEGFDGSRARFSDKPARPKDASTDGETVFLSIFDQCRTIAVDAATGKRRWAFQSKGWMRARPAIGKRAVYVSSQDRYFYAIDKARGAQVWKTKARARNSAAAAIAKRLVLFGSCDGNLYAVDRIMGSVVWKFATDKPPKFGAPIYSQPVVSRDTVYLPAMSGKVYAVELKTGKLKWKFEPLEDSEINSDPAVDGGRLFLTTRRSNDKGTSAVLAIEGEDVTPSKGDTEKGGAEKGGAQKK